MPRLLWFGAVVAIVAGSVAIVSGAVWAATHRRMETAGPSFIEKFNQSVRALVLVAMTGGFVWAFVMGKVSPEVFTTVYAGVLGYWFASREAKARYQEQPTTTTTTPSAKIVTGPTPPTAA
jgi:hypothetical protein